MSDIDDCLKSVERLTRDRGEVMRAKVAEIRARHEAGKAELSLQSEVIDSLNYLHSLEQLHDKDCDWQTQLTNVVWWALELVEKGEQSPSVAPKIWDAFIVGDFDTTLGIATDGARVLLAELIDDRATLLSEVERLREALVLGSEVLASHQGSPGREWHSAGAWLYPGDTIHVVRAPLFDSRVVP